jgi:hypothetical protein
MITFGDRDCHGVGLYRLRSLYGSAPPAAGGPGTPILPSDHHDDIVDSGMVWFKFSRLSSRAEYVTALARSDVIGQSPGTRAPSE